MPQQRRMLRKRAVTSKTGLGGMTIDRMEARGEFPTRVRLSANCVAWVEDEIDQWIDGRLQARGPLPMPRPLRQAKARTKPRTELEHIDGGLPSDAGTASARPTT